MVQGENPRLFFLYFIRVIGKTFSQKTIQGQLAIFFLFLFFLLFFLVHKSLLNWLIWRKPFSGVRHACQGCNKSYKYKEGLYLHQRYECGKDPQFQCPYCAHRAKHKGNLKVHIATKHSKLETWSFFNKILLMVNDPRRKVMISILTIEYYDLHHQILNVAIN